MFNTLVAIGSLAILLFIILLVVAWITENPIAEWAAKHSAIILRVIFGSAVLGSLIYSNYFDYAPCLLCWYQRLCIFPIAILAFTDNIRHSKLLQRQILLLSAAGFLISLYHNYIDIFPPASGSTACGADGVSCLTRYVYEFGFVTIPLMSAITLLAGIIIAVLAMKYPHKKY